MEREDMIKETIFKETEEVKYIGCVIRIYTGIINTDNEINKITYDLLKSLLFCNFSKFLIVIDKKYDKNNNYTNQNNTVVKIIKDIRKINKVINGNIIFLVNDKHYNGTGSFNVAFNYIRNNEEKFKNYLFLFSDDDDIINTENCNKLINDIINNSIEHNKPFDIKRTRRENDILHNKNKYFINSDIIYHKSVAISHLINYASKSDCNFWSILFNPIAYPALTCRLLPFGREDIWK